MDIRQVFPVTVSDDGMTAFMAVAPPPAKEVEKVAVGEVVSYVKEGCKIAEARREVVEELVRLFNEQPEQTRPPEIIAQGRPPVSEKHGEIVWATDFFNPRPVAEQDGSVDFYAVSRVANVSERDLLCAVTPPVAGVPGVNAKGEPLPVGEPKPAAIKAGEGVDFQPDPAGAPAGKYFAARDGRVLWDRQVLAVSPIAFIPGDVDFETGNIDFKGSVDIKRSVLDNFTVKASQDVSVGQWVQAASVEAGGNLVVGAGVAGKDKNVVTVRGDTKVKYLNSAKVRAGGDVSIGAECLASEVVCNGRLRAEKATVTGGTLMVFKGGEVDTLGAPGGTRTDLYLGRNLYAEQEHAAIVKEMKKRRAKVENTLKKIEPYRKELKKLPPEQKKKVAVLLTLVKEEQAQVRDLEERRKEVDKIAGGNLGAKLVVKSTLHAGVAIFMGKETYEVSDSVRGPVTIRYSAEEQRIAVSGA
ncbi:MAG: DUF342 domain-containing protein [Planctomycetes bacterium]|nr:DUF342 domain-containing protein [Planctomycetota bacterium]